MDGRGDEREALMGLSFSQRFPSDKQSLQIQARGTYEVVVDNCLTGSVGLDLEVLGF